VCSDQCYLEQPSPPVKCPTIFSLSRTFECTIKSDKLKFGGHEPEFCRRATL